MDRYTPSPWETSLRMVLSPMPAQMTPGSESATAIAPTDDVFRYPSLTFVQVTPASSVFQTPPATAPK